MNSTTPPAESAASKPSFLSLDFIMRGLDIGYQKATSSGKFTKSAQQLADEYLAIAGSPRQAAHELIKSQAAKAGTSGFISGFGGVFFMAFTLPANITSVLYLQIRMIAAIAHLAGLDLQSDKVQTAIYATLAGTTIKDLVKGSGIVIAQKLAVNAIKSIPGKTLTKINQRVGFKLVTKFGEKGAINLGKTVPFLGAGLGGAFDSITTTKLGNFAIKQFLPAEDEVTVVHKTKPNKNPVPL